MNLIKGWGHSYKGLAIFYCTSAFFLAKVIWKLLCIILIQLFWHDASA